MTDRDDELAAVRDAAQRLIPALSERLGRHGLGEIEVQYGDLRVRVAGSPTRGGTGDATAQGQMQANDGASAVPPPLAEVSEQPEGHDARSIPSPGVGYFVFGDGLGPGLAVQAGDALGFVDVLGVRHEVRAPQDGVVRNLVTESGEAVEYGQTLLELEVAV
jgi:biotin carboxyl carrier protein